jgi:hypothetical protein
MKSEEQVLAEIRRLQGLKEVKPDSVAFPLSEALYAINHAFKYSRIETLEWVLADTKIDREAEV